MPVWKEPSGLRDRSGGTAAFGSRFLAPFDRRAEGFNPMDGLKAPFHHESLEIHSGIVDDLGIVLDFL